MIQYIVFNLVCRKSVVNVSLSKHNISFVSPLRIIQ